MDAGGMGTTTISSPKKRINGERCRHYWLIETPNGAICKGICRFCGEEKEFASSWESLISMNIERKPVGKDISVQDEEFS